MKNKTNRITLLYVLVSISLAIVYREVFLFLNPRDPQSFSLINDLLFILVSGVILKYVLYKSDIKNTEIYKKLKKDGRLYVFTSPARLTDFEKSGELGKAVIKIGYGPHGETVVFDSDEAVKEYNNRHSKPIVTHLGSQDKAEK